MCLLKQLVFTLSTFLLCTLNFPQIEGTYFVDPIIKDGIDIEAVRYDSYGQVLYYSDAGKKTINRYDPDTGYLQILQLDQVASLIIPVCDFDHTFIVTLDRDVVVLYWNYDTKPDDELTNTYYNYFTCLLVSVDLICHGNRWNGGEVDAYGNLWLGTLTILNPPDLCNCPPALYRLLTTQSGLLVNDVAVQSFYQNGVEFSVDYRVMYVLDYYGRQVYSFEFDLPNGIICCPQVVFRYCDYGLKGYPDSIAKDTDGNLWIGSFQGSQVIQINPNLGELLQTIDIPAYEVTSITFGGYDLDILYVGTKQSDGILLDPLGGSVFKVEGLGVYGVQEKEAVVNSFCRPAYF